MSANLPLSGSIVQTLPVRLFFEGDKFGFVSFLSIELVLFNRDLLYKEVMSWANQHGLRPVSPKYLLTIPVVAPARPHLVVDIVTIKYLVKGYVWCFRYGPGISELTQILSRGRLLAKEYLFAFVRVRP